MSTTAVEILQVVWLYWMNLVVERTLVNEMSTKNTQQKQITIWFCIAEEYEQK